jgi:hypothetical protein
MARGRVDVVTSTRPLAVKAAGARDIGGADGVHSPGTA